MFFLPAPSEGSFALKTIPKFTCRIIAGSANNVLATEADGAALFQRGILYAPDYVINSGALIQWWYRQKTYDVKNRRDPREAISDLYSVIRNILKESREKKLAPTRVADRYAEGQLKKEKTYREFHWGYEK